MLILTVIPLKKNIKKEMLTYFTAQAVSPGTIVNVPVRKRIIPALVIDSKNAEDEKSNIKNADFNLKKVAEILGPSPLRDEFFDTLSELKDYYVTETGVLIDVMLPSFVFHSYEELSQIEKPKEISEETASQKIAQEKLVYQAQLEDRLSYYKTYIRGAFAKKESVFIILPTIHEIESFSESLRKGIETYTFVLHSDISEKELVILYNQIVDEPHPILVIATGPFLAIPRYDIKTIIVERESSSAYKTVARPHADIRTIAEIFSKKIRAKLIFGDTLLRPETIWRHTHNHEFGEVAPLGFRRMNEVPMSVVDMREETEMIGREKQVAILSRETKDILDSLKTKNGHVFLFTLKKGLASITECNDCKRAVTCRRCKSPLLLKNESGRKRIFYCTTCKDTTDTLSRCETCGSYNLTPLGIGTERVVELIQTLYPEIPLIRFDKDSIKNEGAAQKAIETFYSEKKAILVGTELSLFYLAEKVDYTIVTSFDSLFAVPNFRINERIIGLVSSLVSYTEKKLLIQTRNPDEKILHTILQGNFTDWYKREISDREQFNYPPFTTLIKISLVGSDEKLARIRTNLEEAFGQWHPIFPESKTRVRGYPTLVMILKVPHLKWSPGGIQTTNTLDTELLELLRTLPQNWSIIIDPQDLN